MNRERLFILIFVLGCILLPGCSFEGGFIAGHKAGHAEGTKEGQQSGFQRGYVNGRSDGHKIGYELGEKKGFTEGKEVGFRRGHLIGYAVGTGHQTIDAFFPALGIILGSALALFVFSMLWIILFRPVRQVLTALDHIAAARYERYLLERTLREKKLRATARAEADARIEGARLTARYEYALTGTEIAKLSEQTEASVFTIRLQSLTRMLRHFDDAAGFVTHSNSLSALERAHCLRTLTRAVYAETQTRKKEQTQ